MIATAEHLSTHERERLMAVDVRADQKALWERLSSDPGFNQIPGKVETTETGQIVIMSPIKFRHSLLCSRVYDLLKQLLPSGSPFMEVSVETPLGLKEPDVVWLSAEFLKSIDLDKMLDQAPTICVEVLSPANTEAEMEAKQIAYFRAGAEEFWICDRNGDMTFHTATGRVEQSALCPNFPNQIDISTTD